MLVSSAQDVAMILSRVDTLLTLPFTPAPTDTDEDTTTTQLSPFELAILASPTLNATRSRNLNDRFDDLRARARHIASFLLDAISADPAGDTAACAAVADVEAHVKQVVAVARGAYTPFTGGSAAKYASPEGQDEKLSTAEQVTAYMSHEYKRLTGVDVDKEIHASCSSCYWILKARVSQPVRTYFSETCAEMQAKILDTIQEPDLRERRRAANRSVDAFLGEIEAQRGAADAMLRVLERLAN
ncbi:hypothetical protein BC830DRAFT_1119158 [Chytriomyces sp. MP71]|nr:hypothetical protein BC830DRAFT_1119158 [Chytriomyces sp. MP71]